MDTVIAVENNSDDLSCLDKYSPNFSESIAKIIKNNGFSKYTIIVNNIDTNNGNYLARLYEVDIKGETDKGHKEIDLFVKESLVLEKIKSINLNDLYDKETFIYMHYANVANKLQEDAEIPEHDRFKFVPAYGGNNEIIILDNLTKQGFKTYFRMDDMPIKYAELAMMELARFHALSFVIETKMPEYFEKNIRTIKTSYIFNDDWSKYVTNICVDISKVINGNREKIANYAPIMKEKMIKYFTIPGNYKNCLSHGDYRMNNVLVKEMDGVPTKVAVVDYQFIDYGNPLRDFFYILYSSSDRKLRQKHIEDLKNIYYNTMMRFLKYFNLDINNIYPRDVFEKAFTESRDYGLIMGLFLASFLFAPDKETLDATKMSLSEINCTNLDVRYKRRVQDIIDEFTELGYL